MPDVRCYAHRLPTGVTPLVKKHGLSRGSGSAPRMLCLADGEPALEDSLRDAFPHALFVNDFAQASDHLHGYYIGSGHVEAAVRVLIVRRCKQAGMHWRHANAVRMAAIHAHFRSHRKAT